MLDNELSNTILAYFMKAPTSEFNGQPVEIEDAWRGHDNLLWRVSVENRKAVLKLYLDAGQARSRRQFDGQQSFAHLGIAPRPLWYDRYPMGLARQVLVYEWMEGETLDPTDLAQVAALARAVAQVQSGDPADVRRFSPNPVNLDYLWRVMQGSIQPTTQWLASRNKVLHALFQQLVERTRALIEVALPLWKSLPPSPVHGDLKLENCLHHFGAAILLDWEMYGLGDPALDAAHLLYWDRRELSQEARSVWLETYLAMLNQPNLAQRIGVYERVLPMQTLCYLFDGLRELAADLPDADTVLPFLQETLAASLQEAMAALSVESPELAQPVATLFDTLSELQNANR